MMVKKPSDSLQNHMEILQDKLSDPVNCDILSRILSDLLREMDSLYHRIEDLEDPQKN